MLAWCRYLVLRSGRPALLNGSPQLDDLAIEGGKVNVQLSNAVMGTVKVSLEAGTVALQHLR
jgi:hypothetical protein